MAPVPSCHSHPAGVCKKLAQVIVIIFKQDFPERWPSYFSDIMQALLSQNEKNELNPTLVEMFLLIMIGIDEEVVSNEVIRTTAEMAQNSVIVSPMNCADHRSQFRKMVSAKPPSRPWWIHGII